MAGFEVSPEAFLIAYFCLSGQIMVLGVGVHL